MKSLLLIAPLVLITALIGLSQKSEPRKIVPVSEELREAFNLKPFYKKALIIESFPILSSEKVPDAALYEAAHIIQTMLKNRPDILANLEKIRSAIRS
jgi:hypothetical protein